MSLLPFGAVGYAVLGAGGAALAKMDEGNWGSCKLCGCGNCQWDAGSFGAKYFTAGLNNKSAFKRCLCGHHFTQHNHR